MTHKCPFCWIKMNRHGTRYLLEDEYKPTRTKVFLERCSRCGYLAMFDKEDEP